MQPRHPLLQSALLFGVAGALAFGAGRRAQAQAAPCATVIELITNDVVGAGVPDDLYLVQVDVQSADPAATARVRKLTVTYESLVSGESPDAAQSLARAFVGGVLVAGTIGKIGTRPDPRAFLVTGDPEPTATTSTLKAARGHLFELTRTGVLSVTLTHHGPLDLSGDPGKLMPTGMAFEASVIYTKGAANAVASATTATTTLPLGTFYFTSAPHGGSNLWKLDTSSGSTVTATTAFYDPIPANEVATSTPANGIEGIVVSSVPGAGIPTHSFFTAQPARLPAPPGQAGEVSRLTTGTTPPPVDCIDLTSVATGTAYDGLAPAFPTPSGLGQPAGGIGADAVARPALVERPAFFLSTQLIGVRSPKPAAGPSGADVDGGVYLVDQPTSGCVTGTEATLVTGADLLAAGISMPETLLYAPPLLPDHLAVTLTPTGEPDTFAVAIEAVDAGGEPVVWISGAVPVDLTVTGLSTTTTSTLTGVGSTSSTISASTSTIELLFTSGVADQLCDDAQLLLTAPGFEDGVTGTFSFSFSFGLNPTPTPITGTFTLTHGTDGDFAIRGNGCSFAANDGGHLLWLLPLALLLAGVVGARRRQKRRGPSPA